MEVKNDYDWKNVINKKINGVIKKMIFGVGFGKFLNGLQLFTKED